MKMGLQVLAVAAVALSGCATITRGTTDKWVIQTTPAGAAVRTSTDFACDATPCTFKMERKAEFDVTVTKAGFKTWHGHVSHHVAGAGGAGFVGNALIGGVIGAGVDVASGAMMDLSPNPMIVTLEQDDPSAAATQAPPAPMTAPAKSGPPESPPTLPAS